MPFIIQDGITIAVDADDEPLMRALAATARRAKTLGEEIGRNLGQGIGLGGLSKTAAGGLTGFSNVFEPLEKAATKLKRSVQSKNMAADMGVGNNFVFAIQDATSAVGQFGFTTTALRFAILGATNNIQVLVMNAALAGVTFRTLTSFITPLHIGLALFSTAVSLLPLLFGRSSAAAKEFTGNIAELSAATTAMGIARSFEQALGSQSKLTVIDAGIKEVTQSIATLKRQSEELKASGELFFDDTAIGAGMELSRLTDDLSRKETLLAQLTKERADAEALVTAEKERQKDLDEQAAMIENARKQEYQNEADAERELVERLKTEALRRGFDPSGIVTGNAADTDLAQRRAEDADRRRRLEQFMRDELGMQDEGELKRKASEAKRAATEAERFRKDTRDAPLQLRQMELDLKRLQMGEQQKFAFVSPEDYINKLQEGLTSGEQQMIKRQDDALRIQELQHKLADKTFEILKNMLPVGAFMIK